MKKNYEKANAHLEGAVPLISEIIYEPNEFNKL